MEYEELFASVKTLITEEHLKELTLRVISAHEKGTIRRYIPLLDILQQPPMQEVPAKDYTEEPPRQLFLLLLKNLHPDRSSYLLSHAEAARAQGDGDKLHQLHAALSFIPGTAGIPVTGRVVESYGYDDEDFDAQEYMGDEIWSEEEQVGDFLSACSAELTGNSSYTLRPFDLSHLTGELVVSGYGISDLDGLAFCDGIEVLDLSDNLITNLYDLKDLTGLLELDLSQNEIDDISDLAGLVNLQILDLSYNDIDDLSALLSLPELQYVNISGNPCIGNTEQLNLLLDRGVIIIAF